MMKKPIEAGLVYRYKKNIDYEDMGFEVGKYYLLKAVISESKAVFVNPDDGMDCDFAVATFYDYWK